MELSPQEYYLTKLEPEHLASMDDANLKSLIADIKEARELLENERINELISIAYQLRQMQGLDRTRYNFIIEILDKEALLRNWNYPADKSLRMIREFGTLKELRERVLADRSYQKPLG